MAQTATDETASNVRAVLGRRRISARELAESLGWSASTTARKIRGDSPFTVDELLEVASHLGIPITSLLPQQVAS